MYVPTTKHRSKKKGGCFHIFDDTLVLWRPTEKNPQLFEPIELFISALIKINKNEYKQQQLSFVAPINRVAAGSLTEEWQSIIVIIEFETEEAERAALKCIMETIDHFGFRHPETSGIFTTKMSVSSVVLNLSVAKPSQIPESSLDSSQESEISSNFSPLKNKQSSLSDNSFPAIDYTKNARLVPEATPEKPEHILKTNHSSVPPKQESIKARTPAAKKMEFTTPKSNPAKFGDADPLITPMVAINVRNMKKLRENAPLTSSKRLDSNDDEFWEMQPTTKQSEKPVKKQPKSAMKDSKDKPKVSKDVNFAKSKSTAEKNGEKKEPIKPWAPTNSKSSANAKTKAAKGKADAAKKTPVKVGKKVENIVEPNVDGPAKSSDSSGNAEKTPLNNLQKGHENKDSPLIVPSTNSKKKRMNVKEMSERKNGVNKRPLPEDKDSPQVEGSAQKKLRSRLPIVKTKVVKEEIDNDDDLYEPPKSIKTKQSSEPANIIEVGTKKMEATKRGAKLGGNAEKMQKVVEKNVERESSEPVMTRTKASLRQMKLMEKKKEAEKMKTNSLKNLELKKPTKASTPTSTGFHDADTNTHYEDDSQNEISAIDNLDFNVLGSDDEIPASGALQLDFLKQLTQSKRQEIKRDEDQEMREVADVVGKEKIVENLQATTKTPNFVNVREQKREVGPTKEPESKLAPEPLQNVQLPKKETQMSENQKLIEFMKKAYPDAYAEYSKITRTPVSEKPIETATEPKTSSKPKLSRNPTKEHTKPEIPQILQSLATPIKSFNPYDSFEAKSKISSKLDSITAQNLSAKSGDLLRLAKKIVSQGDGKSFDGIGKQVSDSKPNVKRFKAHNISSPYLSVAGNLKTLQEPQGINTHKNMSISQMAQMNWKAQNSRQPVNQDFLNESSFIEVDQFGASENGKKEVSFKQENETSNIESEDQSNVTNESDASVTLVKDMDGEESRQNGSVAEGFDEILAQFQNDGVSIRSVASSFTASTLWERTFKDRCDMFLENTQSQGDLLEAALILTVKKVNKSISQHARDVVRDYTMYRKWLKRDGDELVSKKRMYLKRRHEVWKESENEIEETKQKIREFVVGLR